MKNYFTKYEKVLWVASVILILLSFIIFDRENYLTLTASLVGATALIYCAKGNPVGQVLMIIFCLIYGWISYTFKYHGEVLTYICMTLPMAIIGLISWLRNPFRGNHAEVTVSSVTKKDVAVMSILTILVTSIFYFVLKYLGTANLLVSTISVTTSFIAVFLSYKRSPYFALGYAFNVIVLIILWSLACIVDISYLSVVICFIVFLVNDLYGFYNWRKMLKRQSDSN